METLCDLGSRLVTRNSDLSGPRITAINHLTLAVSDIEQSCHFYCDLLGATLRAEWPRGAYLDLGGHWLALELAEHVTPRSDDSHIAFSVSDFDAFVEHLRPHVAEWKVNTSEGASFYFLDPDCHKLELHSGDLETRLAHYRADPESPVRILD